MPYKPKGIFSLEHRRKLKLSHLGQVPANKIVISKKTLAKLYKTKTSVQIAKLFNVTCNTVIRNLKEYNIPVHSIKNGTKLGMDNKTVRNKISKHNKGKHYSIQTEFKKGRKQINKKHDFANHHIYLRENSTKTIKIPYNKHIKLHYQAYRYLVKICKVRAYLKWFDKKYGLYE
jgi:hypothetical protein